MRWRWILRWWLLGVRSKMSKKTCMGEEFAGYPGWGYAYFKAQKLHLQEKDTQD